MKNFDDIKKQLKPLLKPLLKDFDLNLYEINYRHDYESEVLQILVEKTAKNTEALDFDLLVKVNEKISDLLDQIEIIPDNYLLEVASAGLEKPIRTLAELKKANGAYVHLVFKKPKLLTPFVEGKLSWDPQKEFFMVSYFHKGRPCTISFQWDDLMTARYAVKF